MNSESENLLILYLTGGVGDKFLRRFYREVGTFKGDLRELLERFAEKLNIDGEKRKRLTESVFSNLDEKLRKVEELESLGVEIIPFYSERFPKEVETLGVGISLLFCLGGCENLEGFSIVGTRRATVEGLMKAYTFAAALAERRITVVSGGARGVDRKAHEGALAVGGKTGVVLGEGILSFLKRERRFAERVLKEGGFILSQFPPDFAPTKWSFPKRNALIAALGTLGTLVVEAPAKSGALITAEYALQLKRPLYAYLGCTSNPNYAGNLSLIETCRTKLVVNPDRLLGHLKTPKAEHEQKPRASEREEKPQKETSERKKLLGLLSEPKTFDELLALSELGEEKLLELLTELELEGKILSEGGFYRFIK